MRSPNVVRDCPHWPIEIVNREAHNYCNYCSSLKRYILLHCCVEFSQRQTKLPTAPTATKRRRDQKEKGVAVPNKKQRDGEARATSFNSSTDAAKSVESNVQMTEKGLVKPGFFSETKFCDLPLSDTTLAALAALEFTTTTKIQVSDQVFHALDHFASIPSFARFRQISARV